jgi:hypothetical protein
MSVSSPSGGLPPGPGENNTGVICTLEISYGQGPCDEHYIPPDENGQCPEGHRFVDDDTGCVPEGFLNPPTPPITLPTECPEGQTGIPPNCQPINCNVEDPPPECGEQPVVCSDGSTVSPGNECPAPPENGGGPPEGGDEGNGQPPAGGDGNGEDGGNGGDGSNGGDGGGSDSPSLFGWLPNINQKV